MAAPIDELDAALTARNSPGMSEVVRKGSVAVAGLGGLGSNIAVMLARIGVGRLLLVDFDTVELSNLNRQHYDTTHLGMLKTDALRSQIGRINPLVRTETVTARVTEGNARGIFRDYRIICEAFDDPVCKAMLANALLGEGKKIVAASGMNGFRSSNAITTRQVFDDMYVCGDLVPPERPGIGFMAPRVSICAGHQANMAVRLLMGLEDADDA